MRDIRRREINLNVHKSSHHTAGPMAPVQGGCWTQSFHLGPGGAREFSKGASFLSTLRTGKIPLSFGGEGGRLPKVSSEVVDGFNVSSCLSSCKQKKKKKCYSMNSAHASETLIVFV